MLWSLAVLALLAAGVVTCRLNNPAPDGKVAIDFLAAVERGDHDTAASLVHRDTGDPDPRHITPPSTAWHPVGVLSRALLVVPAPDGTIPPLTLPAA